jgi:hypothetical protein
MGRNRRQLSGVPGARNLCTLELHYIYCSKNEKVMFENLSNLKRHKICH